MSADRDRLAAALLPYRWLTDDDRGVLADALMPVVQALVAERAAAELERVRKWLLLEGLASTRVLREMRARAEALTAGSEANR